LFKLKTAKTGDDGEVCCGSVVNGNGCCGCGGGGGGFVGNTVR
jgi:hypothetical protein